MALALGDLFRRRFDTGHAARMCLSDPNSDIIYATRQVCCTAYVGSWQQVRVSGMSPITPLSKDQQM
jgi:hypothetical protein